MSAQGLHQLQKQSQSLVLAPQLRQSLKILQAPTLELRNTILDELQVNPALEELPVDGVSVEENQEPQTDAGDDTGERKELEFSDGDFSVIQRMAEDFREYYNQETDLQPYTTEDEERRRHFFDSLVSETSLQEHLIRQAKLLDLDAVEGQAMEYLIGSLNDRGYIDSTAADIALANQIPLKAVQRTLEALQTLDPPGIGARNLEECLLIQLRQRGREQSLAGRIVRDHSQLLLRRRIPELARRLGVSVTDVQAAVGEIAELDPAPGRKFSEDSNRIIVPDVRVERNGDEWQVILNNDYVPRLRISRLYKDLMASGGVNGKDREYLREKIRDGKFLINSIELRQNTIERIAREIVKSQRDFFDNGPAALKALTMAQIAAEVEVHETTVSRAIANKYMDTPHGIFEFRYFFTTGYRGEHGKSVSNTSVKSRIADIIESENPAKPYSDQKIVAMLQEENLTIARRTVAKYREELDILPAHMRRRYSS